MSASAYHDATPSPSGQDVAIDHKSDRLASAIRRHCVGRPRAAAARRRALTDIRVPVSLLLTGDPVADALTADETAGICRRPATDDLMAIAQALGVAR